MVYRLRESASPADFMAGRPFADQFFYPAADVREALTAHVHETIVSDRDPAIVTNDELHTYAILNGSELLAAGTFEAVS